MALKTFCSRMRRAMSWVYWPPKSSTTTPPRSDCGFRCSSCIFAPVVIARSCGIFLAYNEIEQLILDVNDFHNAFAVQMRGHSGIPVSQFHDDRFSRACSGFQPAAHLAVDLHRNFNFVLARELFAECRPACVPEPLGMAEHFPEFFRKMWGHWRKHQGQQLKHFPRNLRPH